jgi:hypothetical protein
LLTRRHAVPRSPARRAERDRSTVTVAWANNDVQIAQVARGGISPRLKGERRALPQQPGDAGTRESGRYLWEHRQRREGIECAASGILWKPLRQQRAESVLKDLCDDLGRIEEIAERVGGFAPERDSNETAERFGGQPVRAFIGAPSIAPIIERAFVWSATDPNRSSTGARYGAFAAGVGSFEALVVICEAS